MAVLHVISNVMKSGTERMLESVSPTIYPNCKDAGIFAFGAHSTYSAVLSSKGYEIFASNASARSLLALWKYGLILSIRKPKVIHIHIEQNFLAVVAISRIVCARSVIVRTVHGIHDYDSIKLKIRRIIWTRIAVQLFRVNWIAVSNRVSKVESKYLSGEVQVIDNWSPISDKDVESIRKSKEMKVDNDEKIKILLMVGNCDVNKNHFELFKLINSSPGYRVLHLGDTKNSPMDEQAYFVYENVEMLNPNKIEALDAIDMCDAVVIPSFKEAFSIVAVEAIILNRSVHMRKELADTFIPWCEYTDSELSPEYIRINKPLDRDKFLKYFSHSRGYLEYRDVYEQN